jgi:hypothetical protein
VLTESDTASSLVTTFVVAPEGRIYADELDRLDRYTRER